MNTEQYAKLIATVQQFSDDVRAADKVLVEGGHFTLHVRELSADEIRDGACREPDDLLLLKLDARAGPVESELQRVPCQQEPDMVWVVARPTRAAIPGKARRSAPRQVQVIARMITATQLNTFELACYTTNLLRRQGKAADIALLIGDLALPPELREPTRWMLPRSYREMLAADRLADRLRILSEAGCRNQGKRRILDKFKRCLKDPICLEREYAERGFTVIRNDVTQALYLTSDYYLQNIFEFPYVIGMTRDEQTPTCALILAGKFFDMHKAGYSRCISFYDRSDDTRIRRKNLEGALIAAYLIPSFQLQLQLFTIYSLKNRSSFFTDMLAPDTIRNRGSFPKLFELVEEARRRNDELGSQYIELFCSETCAGAASAQ